MGIGGGSSQLLLLLDSDPTQTWTTTQLAKKLGRPKNGLRDLLSRNAKAGKIVRVSYGVYQSPRGLIRQGLPPFAFGVHGLKLEATYTAVGRTFRQMTDRVALIWPSPIQHLHPRNHSFTTTSDWSGRPLTITVHREESGLLEAWCKGTEQPFGILELGLFLKGIPQFLQIPSEIVKVVQSDWGVDLNGRRIVAGEFDMRGLSVATYEKIILKVYQKSEDFLRIEVRSFDRFDSETILDYLRGLLQIIEAAGRRPSGTVP